MKQVAQEIMTKKIVTVGIGDSVRKAYQIMQEKNIRHLPVVDSGGDIIGIISNRDLQRAMLPTKADNGVEINFEFSSNDIVKDFMSWPVRTVADNSLIQDVAETMVKEKISAVIVVGSQNSYRGIITSDDLMKHLIWLTQNGDRKETEKIEKLLDSLPI